MNSRGSAPMPDPLLEVRSISHIFQMSGGLFSKRRQLRALDDVSLQIMPGEVLGIVGESGCGKSTLARVLLGILAPSEGSAMLEGHDMAQLSRRDIAKVVQPVFQDPYSSLNPRKTIREIIELPLRVHGIGTAEERSRAVSEIVSRVGRPTRLLSARPNQLSGGQRQRVAIARALVVRPRIVVCDEPTSALDVSVQAQILDLLMELREAFGLTLVLISHNLAVVEHLSTRVAVMYLGRVAEIGEVEDIFAEPRHPYTRLLLESVLTPDPHAGLPAQPRSDAIPSPMAPPSGCTFHPRCPIAEPACSLERPSYVRIGRTYVACRLAHRPCLESP